MSNNQNQGASIEAERAAFEAAAKEHFGYSGHTFKRTPEGYYNAVHSKTYGGRRQAEFAPVSMLWDLWQAARRTPAAQVGAGELPKKMSWLDAPHDIQNDHANAWSKGWNACRAAIAADRARRQAPADLQARADESNVEPPTRGTGSDTPRVDALMAMWDDDGATRGAAFGELRDLARDLESELSAQSQVNCATTRIDTDEFRDLLDKLWKSMGSAGAARARNAIFRHVEALMPSRCRAQGGITNDESSGAAPAVEVPSIDTPEYRNLLGDMLHAYRKEIQGGPTTAYEKARPKFIAHIDAKLRAAAAPTAPAAPAANNKETK